MTADDPWLNVPQAVVLEATRDIELVLDLTAESPALLQIKASWRLARGAVISPEANPHPGAMGRHPQNIRPSKSYLAGLFAKATSCFGWSADGMRLRFPEPPSRA